MRKVPRRVSLVDAQKEIDGDKQFIQEHQLFEDMDMPSLFDPMEEMRFEEEMLQREEKGRWEAIDRANSNFIYCFPASFDSTYN